MPGDQGEIDLRDHRVVVADDAGKQLFAAGQHAHEVVVDFVFDGFRDPAAVAQLVQVGGADSRGRHAKCFSVMSENESSTGVSAGMAADGLSLASLGRGFVQIVRDVGLPLVMRLVPGDHCSAVRSDQPRSFSSPSGIMSKLFSSSWPSVASRVRAFRPAHGE